MRIEVGRLGIHYETAGDPSGPSVLLLHGMGSSYAQNFAAVGWTDALVAAGFRLVGVDARGCGQSDRPPDAEGYRGGAMVRDAIAVLDAEDIDRAHVVGYSMGAGNTLRLGLEHPDRVQSLSLCGLGGIVLTCAGVWLGDEATSRDRLAKGRQLIERLSQMRRSDDANYHQALFAALAADPLGPGALEEIAVPTLIALGENDTAQGDFAAVAISDMLVRRIAGAQRVIIAGKDHLTVCADAQLHEATVGHIATTESH